VIDGYACSSWDASGPEVAYTYTANTTGSVTAALSNITEAKTSIFT